MAEELQTYLLEHFQWLHRHPELALKVITPRSSNFRK